MLSPGQSIHVGPAYMEASGWLHTGRPHVMAACPPLQGGQGSAFLQQTGTIFTKELHSLCLNLTTVTV